MDRIHLAGLTKCQGRVELPGSKSIANRALLMAALCNEPTELTNLLRSDDTDRMIDALRALGVTVVIDSNTPTKVMVKGTGGHWSLPEQPLDLGNAGTAMRPLTAVLAATLSVTQSITLTGNQRMRERPIAALVDALTQAGAAITYQQQLGYPPIQISGAELTPRIRLDASASSQYVSALLMALPLLPHDSVLTLSGELVSWPYIELTLNMLARFGIHIDVMNDREFLISGSQQYQSPQTYWVEGDASAASYWLALGVLGGGPLIIEGVGSESIQGDKVFAEVLQRMGANIAVQATSMTVSGGHLQGIQQDFNSIPDAAMTIATLALFAQGPTAIRNVANWRIKETDRLTAMATELRKVGAEVIETEDSLTIYPPTKINHAEIATYDDHRMAMCFALLGFAKAGVTILDPDCCKKTYPEFFKQLQQLCS